MTIEIFDTIEQGTEEWLAVRAGIPTASVFKEVMMKPGPRGGIPKGRQKLLWKLAGEAISGIPESGYSNAAMERGHEREDESRSLYSMITDNEVRQVGFIRNGNCGCSPDGLIDDDGMWENKDAIGSVQIERLLNGKVIPSEHMPQCQGQLMVAERDWIDFTSYSRGLPPLIVRVRRDERYIAGLRHDVNEFVAELNDLIERIRRMS